MKSFTAFFTILFLVSSVFAVPTDEEIEKKVNELLSKMTLAEKIGQMCQRNLWSPQISDQLANDLKNGQVGSFLNAGDLDMKNRLQKIAVEESRLGIPLIYGRDVIHGYQTVLPIPVGQSCSWNPELIEKGARMAAEEASANGVHWTFAPMIDITRDPRWGRIAETWGEDPYLTSGFAKAMVRGFQGEDLSAENSLAACAKHYVGYGDAVGGRDYNSTFIPEIQLRNIFLPPFHAAVDQGVATLMSAFNEINGIPATGNKFTLSNILRGEWGFDGYVVSDWSSMTEMIAHGFCKDEKDVAEKSINAGIDMEMVSEAYRDNLKTLVKEGVVSEKLIDKRVGNILRIKLRKGLFDHPYTSDERQPVILSDEHLQIAKDVALQSIVMLKNEGTLPLSDDQTVAVIGPLANAPVDQMGTWSMDGKAEAVVTPLVAFRDMLGQDQVNYAAGLESSRDTSEEGFDAAVIAANKSDAVVLFLGEEQILSGEAKCRAFLDLPGAQEALVKVITELNKPVVAVIMAGRPLTFPNIEKHLDAILYAWHPGTMGGPAIADLVFGNASPSGKLTTTFPRTVGQVPIYYAHKNTGRPPQPRDTAVPLGTPLDPQGFTSKYLDVDITPRFPFGFGLSYASFDYKNLKVSPDWMSKDGVITVSADITNTGQVQATEVAQLYIRDLVGSATRPVKELKGFTRATLDPGETKTVSFQLNAKDCGFYGPENKFIVEQGDFKVWIGWDSAHGLEGEFKITE